MTKFKKYSPLIAFIIIIVAFYTFFGFHYNTNRLYPEWTNAQTMQSIEFVSKEGVRFDHGAKNGDASSFGNINISFDRNGCEITEAYLHINAHIEENENGKTVKTSLRTSEDICFGIYTKNVKKCEHISMQDNKIATPKKEREFGYFYDLKNMKFLEYDEIGADEGSFKNANILKRMNECNNCKASAFISSIRKNRVLNKMTIYYKTKDNCEIKINK